ncbi:MAG: acetyl-CoA carboxylase, biotin carboxyl carrier protein [Spirochaetia bacterium]|nr:acetyl-CoA carboxylase, biotin carboxyl carrier protein [Spirochaetia bacterium]
MQTKEIEKLISLLQSNHLNEIEYREKELYIRVKKDNNTNTREVETAPTVEKKSTHHVIKSPIVGTFYRTPSPDSPPYVEKGTIVKKGDVLCTLEAMKLMNQLVAEFDCEIVSILADQATLVEYDQGLFEVKPL